MTSYTSHSDNFEIFNSNVTSPKLVCFLISVYFTGCYLKFYLFSLYLPQLAGNIYIHAIVFGVAWAISGALSGSLVTKFSDMNVFKTIMTIEILCYTVLIFLPDVNSTIIYIVNGLFVSCIILQQTLGFVIAELRVPPQSLGAVLMICQTVGIAICCFVPFIAQM